MIHEAKLDRYKALISGLWHYFGIEPKVDWRITKKDGRVIVSYIRKHRFRFKEGQITAGFERAELDESASRLLVTEHRYHYQPDKSKRPAAYYFRIENDSLKGLHANPDEATGLDHDLYPADLELNIRNFNLLYFALVAMAYHQGGPYPLFPVAGGSYNRLLEPYRREVEEP